MLKKPNPTNEQPQPIPPTQANNPQNPEKNQKAL